jgi:hypothetical protein
MNKEWSELNKTMQSQIKNRDTYRNGINTLFELRELPYEMLKQKVPAERREILQSMNVVSSDENAVWLIDYWCGKDIRGLIQMPFSRHWIMHIEASLRIRNKIHKQQ